MAEYYFDYLNFDVLTEIIMGLKFSDLTTFRKFFNLYLNFDNIEDTIDWLYVIRRRYPYFLKLAHKSHNFKSYDLNYEPYYDMYITILNVEGLSHTFKYRFFVPLINNISYNKYYIDSMIGVTENISGRVEETVNLLAELFILNNFTGYHDLLIKTNFISVYENDFIKIYMLFYAHPELKDLVEDLLSGANKNMNIVRFDHKYTFYYALFVKAPFLLSSYRIDVTRSDLADVLVSISVELIDKEKGDDIFRLIESKYGELYPDIFEDNI